MSIGAEMQAHMQLEGEWLSKHNVTIVTKTLEQVSTRAVRWSVDKDDPHLRRCIVNLYTLLFLNEDEDYEELK